MIARIKNSAPLRLCAKYFSTRAANDYSTHVPVLIGLSRLRRIRSVLEFGCGYYSTLTFLNRAVFPRLERLHSIENDKSWSERVAELAKRDARWTIDMIDGDIAGCISNLDLEGFDLILIDDSKTSAERAATIRAIANRQPQHPWIVIHDFDVEEYRNAARGFQQQHSFRAYNPHTGLACNKPFDVASLDRLLKQNKHLPPDDINAWLRHL